MKTNAETKVSLQEIIDALEEVVDEGRKQERADMPGVFPDWAYAAKDVLAKLMAGVAASNHDIRRAVYELPCEPPASFGDIARPAYETGHLAARRAVLDLLNPIVPTTPQPLHDKDGTESTKGGA